MAHLHHQFGINLYLYLDKIDEAAGIPTTEGTTLTNKFKILPTEPFLLLLFGMRILHIQPSLNTVQMTKSSAAASDRQTDESNPISAYDMQKKALNTLFILPFREQRRERERKKVIEMLSGSNSEMPIINEHTQAQR